MMVRYCESRLWDWAVMEREWQMQCKAAQKAKLVGAISGTPSKLKDWQTKYNIPEKNCYNYENFDQHKKQS